MMKMLLVTLLFSTTAFAAVPDAVKKELARQRGQTTYVNAKQSYRMMPRSFSAVGGGGNESPMAKSAAGGRREQQESDIFKVLPGTKLLYLLNDNRGLQVVSFAKGAESPRLTGRAAPTGNDPDNMYLDAANKRLIVLERNWNNEESDYSTEQSRLVIYDITNAKKPKLVQTVAIEGEITDSRMVGDVLYVATSVLPDWRSSGRGETGKGMLFSFSLGKKKEVTQIDKAELRLPTSRRDGTMGITEIFDGKAWKYYATAILSESRWGWWDRQSVVELLDISNSDGKITPVMTVSAKGRIERRQQVTLKDGVLLVTSNYTTEGAKDTRGIDNLALESFALPTEKSEVLTEAEAQYRKLHIDRQLVGKSGEAADALRAQLVADKKLGIKGRFVKAEDGGLRKITADQAITLGDDKGMSLSLRDVRYVDNRAYLFSVPVNEVDPFDVVDISKPAEALTHLKRLEYPGWIEKTFPVTYKGHEYIIGLGWVVDAVNNESGRRRPQAKLLEVVTKPNGRLILDEVATLKFASAKIWANLNDLDKFIEVRFSNEGKGSILFSVSSYENDRYVDGGKLVGFDLEQAEVNPDKVFTEGGMLASENAGWLKRVFNNDEISKINTFSNTTLGTFDASLDKVTDAKSIQSAISTLELARDIRGYVVVNHPVSGEARGVQIISEGSRWTYNGTAKTTLRLVKTSIADAEKNMAEGEITVPGAYVSHRVGDDGMSVLVLTTSTNVVEKGDERSSETTEAFYVVKMADRQGLEAVATTSWKTEERSRRSRELSMNPRMESAGITAIAPTDIRGRYIVSSEGNIKLVELTKSKKGYQSIASTTSVELVSDMLEKQSNPTILELDGKLYVTFEKNALPAESEEVEARREISFTRHYIAPVEIQADGKWTHGKAINIPGEPVAVFGGDHLVTQDNRLMDVNERTEDWGDQKKHVRREPLFEQNLVSLKIDGDKAVLADLLRADQINVDELKVANKGLVYLEEGSTGYRPRGPWMGGVVGGRRRFGSSESRFAGLTFDANLFFNRQLQGIRGLELKGNPKLAYVTEDAAQPGRYIGVLTSGQKGQIITWTDGEAPTVVAVKQVNASHKRGADVTVFDLPPGGYWWGYSSENAAVNFNSANRSLELASGLGGVCQVYLTNKPSTKIAKK